MTGQADATDFSELMKRYLAEQESRRVGNRVAFAANKAMLMPVLIAAGVATLELPFDGCGDSGMVEAPETGDPVDLATLLQTSVSYVRRADEGGVKTVEMTLGAALEDLTYEALSTFHPGWEINEGSSGRLVIDTDADEISLQCSLRMSEYHETEIGDE